METRNIHSIESFVLSGVLLVLPGVNERLHEAMKPSNREKSEQQGKKQKTLQVNRSNF